MTGSAAPPGQDRTTERIGETAVDARTLPALAAPLAGERYIAADGCCDASRHTRAMLPVNGQTYVAQRYAIDYEQAEEQHRIFTGDPVDPASYVIFGADVHAVADGTVVGMPNDLPEQVPGTYPADVSLADADGNYVVLNIGDGFYVNYAHMQPGSVRVNVGDEVKTGDVLGLVGNSGNSVAPHLHLHVMDAPTPIAAQGLPYLIDRFTITVRSPAPPISTPPRPRASRWSRCRIKPPASTGINWCRTRASSPSPHPEHTDVTSCGPPAPARPASRP